jgi:hypothetical protein
VRENRDTNGYENKGIANFFASFKKGSRSIRRVLEKNDARTIVSVDRIRNKFCDLVGVNLNSIQNWNLISSLWTKNFLQKKIRDFTFKFYNNILGTNTRVANFVNGHDRTCTFCKITDNNALTEETFFHLFFERKKRKV